MKKNFLLIVLVGVSFIIQPVNDYAADNIGEELRLYVGQAEILSVSNPTRIVIGNPSIVDVIQATKTEVTLSPKATGSTNLVIWDNFGEQSYRIKVLSGDLEDIKLRLDNLLGKLSFPKVYTQVIEEEDKILLLGKVSTPQDRERLTMALGVLKEKVVDLIRVEEENMVEIDVQVLELSSDATKTLGFTMPASISVGETPDRFSKTLRGSLDAIWHVFDWPRNEFTATINALVQEGKAKILSRPRLACQSGKEAELLVGGEKPIFTTEISTGGAGTEVEYKEYGIKLKIKPTVISEEKKIKLALNVEVSEVGAAEFIGLTTQRTAQAYPLTKRNASTELFLNDGQTLAIGGLIKQKTEEDVRKTAGLGDIPILGMLFRRKTTKIGGGEGERGNTELFITLTPTIINQGKEQGKKQISSRSRAEDALFSVTSYARIIQKRILENLVYPTYAKEAGFQGTVKLGLHIFYTGELLEVKVESSSGYKVLDDNAVSVAQSIFSYPPFPPSLELKELWVNIPIAYQLE